MASEAELKNLSQKFARLRNAGSTELGAGRPGITVYPGPSEIVRSRNRSKSLGSGH